MRCEKAMFRCEVDCKSPVTVSTGFSYQLPSGASPSCNLVALDVSPCPHYFFFFSTSLSVTLLLLHQVAVRFKQGAKTVVVVCAMLRLNVSVD